MGKRKREREASKRAGGDAQAQPAANEEDVEASVRSEILSRKHALRDEAVRQHNALQAANPESVAATITTVQRAPQQAGRMSSVTSSRLQSIKGNGGGNGGGGGGGMAVPLAAIDTTIPELKALASSPLVGVTPPAPVPVQSVQAQVPAPAVDASKGVGAEMLVGFTKELAIILFQFYFNTAPVVAGQPLDRTRPFVAKFSKNYFHRGLVPHLYSITDDLGLERPFQMGNVLYLHLRPRPQVQNIAQVQQFVSTALRIPLNATPATPQQPRVSLGGPLVRPDARAPPNAVPWTSLISQGTLCMRHYFEGVANSRQKADPRALDAQIEALLKERVRLLCGHGVHTVTELSAFEGVRCRVCLRRYWWSWCDMQVAVVCSEYHKASKAPDASKPAAKRPRGDADSLADAVWHCDALRRCLLADEYWQCSQCSQVVRGLTYPCPKCVKNGAMVYHPSTQPGAVFSPLVDVVEMFAQDARGIKDVAGA